MHTSHATLLLHRPSSVTLTPLGRTQVRDFLCVHLLPRIREARGWNSVVVRMCYTHRFLRLCDAVNVGMSGYIYFILIGEVR